MACRGGPVIQWGKGEKTNGKKKLKKERTTSFNDVQQCLTMFSDAQSVTIDNTHWCNIDAACGQLQQDSARNQNVHLVTPTQLINKQAAATISFLLAVVVSARTYQEVCHYYLWDPHYHYYLWDPHYYLNCDYLIMLRWNTLSYFTNKFGRI